MGTAQRGLFIDYTIAMLEAAVNGLNTCTFFYDGKKEVGGGGRYNFYSCVFILDSNTPLHCKTLNISSRNIFFKPFFQGWSLFGNYFGNVVEHSVTRQPRRILMPS